MVDEPARGHELASKSQAHVAHLPRAGNLAQPTRLAPIAGRAELAASPSPRRQALIAGLDTTTPLSNAGRRNWDPNQVPLHGETFAHSAREKYGRGADDFVPRRGHHESQDQIVTAFLVPMEAPTAAVASAAATGPLRSRVSIDEAVDGMVSSPPPPTSGRRRRSSWVFGGRGRSPSRVAAEPTAPAFDGVPSTRGALSSDARVISVSGMLQALLETSKGGGAKSKKKKEVEREQQRHQPAARAARAVDATTPGQACSTGVSRRRPFQAGDAEKGESQGEGAHRRAE